MNVALSATRCGAVLCLIILASCAGFRNGPAPIIATKDIPYQGVRERVKAAVLSDCLDIGTPVGSNSDRQVRRNRLVSAYIFTADVAYNEYERNLLDSIRESDLGATAASLALSGIGSVIGTEVEELARALDVTNTILTGTRTAISREYLLNQSLTTLQTHMRASRLAQRAVILERRSLTINEWDSCQALSDVLAFEQSGTLNAAIAAMAASAAASEQQGAAAVARAIDRVTYTTNALVESLRAYFSPSDNALMTTRLGRAQDYLTAAGLTVPAGMRPGERLMRVLDGADPAELRLLAFGVLRTETDQGAKAPIVSALTGNGG